MNVYDLGFSKDCQKIWDFQKAKLSQRIEGKTSDSLILVEHDHVITLGRSSHPENVLTNDLPIFEIERGGDATYHGPGQLVIYPIISLEQRGISVRKLVETLESVIIHTIADFGIKDAKGLLGKETGVWVGKRKIASIGVAVSHWVSFHGVALNVNTDLSYFQKIRPCGYEPSIMTSMRSELSLYWIDMNKVKETVLKSFGNHLSVELTYQSEEIG